jgi:hypothetical protein
MDMCNIRGIISGLVYWDMYMAFGDPWCLAVGICGEEYGIVGNGDSVPFWDTLDLLRGGELSRLAGLIPTHTLIFFPLALILYYDDLRSPTLHLSQSAPLWGFMHARPFPVAFDPLRVLYCGWSFIAYLADPLPGLAGLGAVRVERASLRCWTDRLRMRFVRGLLYNADALTLVFCL